MLLLPSHWFITYCGRCILLVPFLRLLFIPPLQDAEADDSQQILSRYPGQDDLISPHVAVWVLSGSTAILPCNLTAPTKEDSVKLVLWYKRGILKPVYSYDLRSNPPSHWKNVLQVDSRVSFNERTAALTLQRVSYEDQDQYFCRVDFSTSPTLSYYANLTVVVPPRRVAVYTDLGAEARDEVGPFLEGSIVRLRCQATGGSPSPVLTWWDGSNVIDQDQEQDSPDLFANTLTLDPLTRADLHRTVTCTAKNTNLTAPQQTKISIDMHFPPLSVRILNSRDSLSAGEPYTFMCLAVGARPPALITWHLNDTVLSHYNVKVSDKGNVTRSELRMTPAIQDEGKVLKCTAETESPLLHSSTKPLSDKWPLDIYYVPHTAIYPGRSLNLSNIEEGDDVYFECSIKANPKVYKISWLHQGQELIHNVLGGVIVSNQSLVLQKVTRQASGNYYCMASNFEGDGKSNPIQLKVKYAPVCRGNQMLYHGAARYEQVNIPCVIDAYPMPSTFRWTFNNSGESVDIPQDHIELQGSRSTVHYTPMTELDYGTLLCWGTNEVGRQKGPCIFHVFPAGRPDPVHNCSIYNLSVSQINVRCVAGFDGGLTQTFILELYDPHTGLLLSNTTNTVPTLEVAGLEPGNSYTAVVYSTNNKGRGEMVSLPVYTLKDVAEKRTAAVKPGPGPGNQQKWSPVGPGLLVILAVTGGLIMAIVLILVAVKIHYHRRRYASRTLAESQSNKKSQQPLLESSDHQKSQQSTPLQMSIKVPSTGICSSVQQPGSEVIKDENNPDIIPQRNQDGLTHWHISGVQTISRSNLSQTLSHHGSMFHSLSQTNMAQINDSCRINNVSGACGTAMNHPRYCYLHQPDQQNSVFSSNDGYSASSVLPANMEITVSSKDHHHQHLLHTATLPKKMSRQTYNVQTLQQQQQPYPPPRFTSCDISEQRDLDDPNGQIEAMWTNSSEKSPACSNAMPQEKCGVDQCLIQAGCSIGAQDNCTQHRQVSHDCILHNKSCWIQKSIHRRHSFNNPYHSGMQKESSV